MNLIESYNSNLVKREYKPGTKIIITGETNSSLLNEVIYTIYELQECIRHNRCKDCKTSGILLMAASAYMTGIRISLCHSEYKKVML